MDIGLDLYSYHLNTQAGLNNNTPGVYASFEGATAGVYRNSHDRTSVFAGYVFETSDRKLALLAGAVSGYKPEGKSKILPMLIPSLRLALASQWALRASYVPRPPHGDSASIHLSLEFTTDK